MQTDDRGEKRTVPVDNGKTADGGLKGKRGGPKKPLPQSSGAKLWRQGPVGSRNRIGRKRHWRKPVRGVRDQFEGEKKEVEPGKERTLNFSYIRGSLCLGERRERGKQVGVQGLERKDKYKL